MTRTNWTALSEKLLAGESRLGRDLECRIGTVEHLVTQEHLADFRLCGPETVSELSSLLEDVSARHFVKMVVVTARDVPLPLVPALLLAGARTRNPSFNKHFTWPCVLCHGRRIVVRELLRIFRTGSPDERAGAAHGLYWGSMGRGSIYWPHDKFGRPSGRPDEPVDDLLDEFASVVLSELLAEPDVAIQRVLVANLPKRTADNAELFDRVVERARGSADEYLRKRLAYQLGESELIPCLPERDETSEGGWR